MKFGSLNALLLVAVLLALGQVTSHPTRYHDIKFNGNGIPAIRSYHIHVMFEKHHSSDSCIGYDDAMVLRDRFQQVFNVNDLPCDGDFDQGRFCFFPVQLKGFGPFVGPQWSCFVPFEHFAAVSQWASQNRGPFDVFIHPNSGFERNDHSDWGLWGGKPWPLDLSAMEFVPTLPPLFNTTCRDEPAVYPWPVPPSDATPGKAHVRFLYTIPQGPAVTVKTDDFQSPSLAAMDKTWYFDFEPSQSTTFTTSRGETLSLVLTADSWHTLFITDKFFHIADDNTELPAGGKIRFVNLLGSTTIVAIYRNGAPAFPAVAYEQASSYDSQAEGQYFYSIVDLATGRTILTEPYYINTGATETVILVAGRSSAENPDASAILAFDYPRDS